MFTLTYKGYYLHGCFTDDLFDLVSPDCRQLGKGLTMHQAKCRVTRDINNKNN